MRRAGSDERIPVLYLAPWVDHGGSDKGTIDWFRWLDRDRFRASIITTQPSPNGRLSEVLPYADEVWVLPDLMARQSFPRFILDFVSTRAIAIVHLMNSRLGFDLLPDFDALPDPPSTVVQLHVEEPDRSGYVRYVTTRYGNLVDAFSVTSRHLAEAVAAYDVRREKIHVIHTGVDAEREFSPARVPPAPDKPDGLDLLYAGRLVEQKNPWLMVDVAAALRDAGERFRIHVVGDGDLADPVRAQVTERRLEDHVLFHGPTHEMRRWYAACEALMMTSRFEGMPFTAAEAMAMGLPVVAPALPGNVELMGDNGGLRISPPDDVDAYVQALAGLAADPGQRARVGAEGRARMVERFSVAQAADAHAELYEALLHSRREPAHPPAPEQHDAPTPIALRGRPALEQPLVSVIVPCFNHGRYLPACLESVRAQTYPSIETIVVDDGSTDGHTRQVIDDLEQEADLTVIRLPDNSGPSAARNAAIEAARGRYVLPLDADNLLVRDAVERLVGQLQGAGERIGFIYPNQQFFGNRDDYFEAPQYSLPLLLRENYCDTSSLIDRDVFDAGIRFGEDIALGHEDWDFALQLAEREVYGEPAHGESLLVYKSGFTRCDRVEHRGEFYEAVRRRHPALYRRAGAIKSAWDPEISVIGLAEVEPNSLVGDELRKRLRDQSCGDAELIVPSPTEWQQLDAGPRIRRIAAELASSPLDLAAAGIAIARGRYLLLTTGDGSELFADRGVIEKVLRRFGEQPQLGAIAFAEAGVAGQVPFRLVGPHERVALKPHAVVWREEIRARPLKSPRLEDSLLTVIYAAYGASGGVEWRHMPAPRNQVLESGPSSAPDAVAYAAQPEPTRPKAPGVRAKLPPALPSMPEGAVRRLEALPAWMPAETDLLCRYRQRGGEHRITSTSAEPPADYEPERELGAIRRFHLPGTAPLHSIAGPRYLFDANPRPAGAHLLGHVELAAFPMLQPLVLAIHPGTGQEVLVSGASDPLMPRVKPIATLGWIEPIRSEPPELPDGNVASHLLLGLVRGVDRRRHTYGLGDAPGGIVEGELGALPRQRAGDVIAASLTTAGLLVTDEHNPVISRARVAEAIRWAAEPASWRRFSKPGPKTRSLLRRTSSLPRHCARRRRTPANGRDIGYLFRGPGVGRVPLYAAIHPVTGDQLLSRAPTEAIDMGYGKAALLGYMLDCAPVLGSNAIRRAATPWASRFGLQAATG